MKLLTVVGARPQFVKAAIVSKLLSECKGIQESLVHTGQHYDDEMSDSFFRELGIPEPKNFLDVGSGSHGEQTGKMLERVERVMIKENPDLTLVYGDTNSTLAGALASSKLGIPVAHVEAGLRSFNRSMPEEINRIVVDHLSDHLFSPTSLAVANLKKEGISDCRISLTGDVMYDAAIHFGDIHQEEALLPSHLGLLPGKYILATVHRAENTDSRKEIRKIISGLSLVAKECDVVLPLHPRTKKVLDSNDLMKVAEDNFIVLRPLGYYEMLQFEKNAKVIATDSGGVQKEAFFLGIPCITMRRETEWVELIELGVNQLAGHCSPKELAEKILSASFPFQQDIAGLYGGGEAVKRIVQKIKSL